MLKTLFCLVSLALLVSNNLAIKLVSETNFVLDESKIYTRVIRMINSRPSESDSHRCSIIALNRDHYEYIIKLEPIADKRVAHHMTITACKFAPDVPELQEGGNTWQCDKKGYGMCGYDPKTESHPSRRLYTWALDAEGVTFPEGAGLRVGGDTGLNYVVVQVHYNTALDEEHADNLSRYLLTMTTQNLPYQVGVYTLGNNGFIPPKRRKFTFEAACEMKLPYDIVPIFYRTHAHQITEVISGYVVRDSTQWTELGRMSPRQPQAFYPVTNAEEIVRQGDILASRCTHNSMSQDKTIWTGHKHEDEMCVFYLMFYTDYKKNLQDVYCFKDGNKYSWSFDSKLRSDPPSDASSLEGVLLDPILEIEAREELYQNKHI